MGEIFREMQTEAAPDALQVAWGRLIEHCHANGLGDVLMTVRAGYAAELNSERRARHEMVRDAVTAERERWRALLEAHAAGCERAAENYEDPKFDAMARVLMSVREAGSKAQRVLGADGQQTAQNLST